MAYLDTPTRPAPRVSPELFIGAASPLWSYFGAVAAGGVAFWWMTRWTQPVNLEAFFEATRKATLPALEPMIEAGAAVSEAVIEVAAAPIEALGSADAEPAPAPESANDASERPKRGAKRPSEALEAET